jgi:CRP-like cAMP-binding protein
MSLEKDTHHMVDTEAFQFRLPSMYQDLLMFPTLLKTVKKEMRLFQDLGTHIQLCLAYQFESANFVRGDTVVKENEKPPGLMFIRQGSMIAIHTDTKRGGIVRLYRGDFFGEICLSFNFVSPVIIKATSDCEVFVLYKNHYQKFMRFLPEHVRSHIIMNHADIINTIACRYHEKMVVSRPRFFAKSVGEYREGKEFSLTQYGVVLEAARGAATWLTKLHDGLLCYKRWTYSIGIIGVIATGEKKEEASVQFEIGSMLTA